ncbi:structural maintenance of chromosome complex subunit SmcA [Cordyceps fumosorosea ARSEF 2679]|uniref:Structural maintenance of chromosomes protein 5 n=1 Tax=Cordyceps fumosorosea (strain ARSEF 2679) TaxID=1081104 RepID=A0A167ZL09_CORFA|nr:structural maintenance of chromosome complex subunit SmcA [Cordyceps fumosorosea ARSEF 2679]OAA67640.1 structural maintenance of chromosome complex subunit SmcA [Cordyceps fumosorosea ARSEF 2679]
MPLDNSRRRRRVESDDETDDGNIQTPELPKRPRRSTLLPQDEVNGDSSHTNGASHSASMEEFQPGSIVRVSVQNFVTYERADFFPGPYLNMIIGPNGTGKSSLVCAICLGLGYSPKHLGRAGSIKEFVKHGKDKATIEIELQKKPNVRHNYVIKVQIRRDQNTQKWWLNGKETTHKKIQELMASLKIQVDNLCQFLPQDRVVEFAASTPVQLLHETIRAAAPEEMLIWQSQLRELFKEKKGLTENSQNDVETLENLMARQEGLQAEVDRLRERDEIQKRLDDLKIVKVLVRYQEARDRFLKAKELKKKAQESLRRLETESGPSLQAVNRKEAYLDKLKSALSGKERALQQCHDVSDALDQKVKDEQASMDAFDTKMVSERKLFNARKNEVAAARARLTSLQADLKNCPGEFNASEWNQKIRAEEHELRDLESTDRELGLQLTNLKDEVRGPKERTRTLTRSLESLDTHYGQQVNLMKKKFPEVAQGWEWIQAHMGEFEKEVFGPPMISCSIKDERFSSQVQSLLQVDDFTCFTVQTRSDYKKLSDQLYRVMSLSVVIRSSVHSLENFQTPTSRNETLELGLDGFAVDYVEGPEPVLAMLCSEKRLHQSGIALQEHDNAQYNRLANSGTITQWAAGKHTFSLRRRKEYGGKAMTAISKLIASGGFWTSQGVDVQEKAELTRQLAEAQAEVQTLKERNTEVLKKRTAIERQKQAINAKIDDLKTEKSALQREYQKWKSLPDKIEAEERRREENMEMMEVIRNRMYAAQYDLDKMTMDKFSAAMRHAASLENMMKAHEAFIEASIRSIEATSDLTGLKGRNAKIVARLADERGKLEEATASADRARTVGREMSDEVKDLLTELGERRLYLQDLAEGKTEHEIDVEMAAEQAQLELIYTSDPNILREFERRAQDIERLQRKIDSISTKAAELAAAQDSLMNKFEPKLDELVTQINSAFAYNFEQISCSGEVRIHKDEDFEQWALNIMVRFRENETLQQLNAHRQSGGERAVSTVFFLMALQSLAQSPFRVVDEINQGMDPRNERMVHERMVEIACREHTSQYFLITPKLLPGLRYDPKMRLLCIASGKYMPRDGAKLDFGRCLAVMRGMAATRA